MRPPPSPLPPQGRFREEIEKTRTSRRARKLADELADLVAHAILLATNEDIDIEDAIRRKWLSYL